MARTQAADVEHHRLFVEARLVLGDHRIDHGLVLGDHLFGVLLDLVVEVGSDFPQRRGDLGGTEEVVFHPGNAVLLFHVPADVVHRAVAVEQVELDLGGLLHLLQGAVAGPLGHHAQAHLLEQDARRPGVAADVVVADDGHVVRAGRVLGVGLVQHPVAHLVVGDVVAEGLGHAAEAFAAHRHDGLAGFIALLLGHRLDVVADQADRAFGLDRDAVGEGEQLVDLVDHLLQLLVAAEDNVLLLEVGGDLQHDEVVHADGAAGVVAPGAPGILAAAHRAVGDVHHVLDRAPHHAFRAGVGAAADGHDAGQGLDVGLHAAVGLALFIHVEVLGALLGRLFRIGFQHLVDQRLVARLVVENRTHGFLLRMVLRFGGRPVGARPPVRR